MRARRALSMAILASALVAGAAQAQTPQMAPAAMGDQDLRPAMRKLWADHVVWTRNYIIAAVAGTPDATPVLNRLLKNQEDIGNAIVPFYGAPAGAKLTS